jgi:diguanylate cyclase (GGDEF)-like protein
MMERRLDALLAECVSSAQRDRQRPLVLVVDDAPINIEVLARVLDGYEVIFACSGAEALSLAAAQGPDLILLDVMMPGLDGFDVCRILKADPQLEKIPVIFITAMTQDVDQARGLDVGAIDYITKPIRQRLVRARVRNHLELKLARDLLERRAVVDGLTGVANRRRFDEFLLQEWLRAGRNQLPCSLILLDIDMFKTYNDCYGHLAGDDCLRKVARALAGALHRPADLVARYGGEEFACVLPETDAAGASLVAKAIEDSIHALNIPHERSSVSHCLTVSQGVASCRPLPAHSGSSLLVYAADRLLYAAKEAGRDRIVAADMDVVAIG